MACYKCCSKIAIVTQCLQHGKISWLNMWAVDGDQGALHRWKDARGDFNTSRLFSICCVQVSERQVIWMQEMWPQTCYHQVGQLEAGKTDALRPISELWGNCPAVECWWCACITIDNLSQNKGNGLRQPHTKGEVAPESQAVQEAVDLGHREALLDSWTVVSSYLLWWVEVLHFLRNWEPRVWRKLYETDKPSCIKSSIKFPQSTWSGKECQQLELDLFVFCQQMLLLLSIKKSWGIFCFWWLSNCLEVMNSHSNTTWLLPILSNLLRRGLPRMGYRFCLGHQQKLTGS